MTTHSRRVPLSPSMFMPPAQAERRRDPPMPRPLASMTPAHRRSLSTGRRASTGDLLVHSQRGVYQAHQYKHKRARSPMRKGLRSSPKAKNRSTSKQEQPVRKPTTGHRPSRPRAQSRQHHSRHHHNAQQPPHPFQYHHRSNERRLSQYLLSTVKRTKFKSFLRKQFAYENLMFVEKVNHFREQCLKLATDGGFPTLAARNQAALELYFEFLTPESIHEVHADSHHRDDLENSLKQAVPNFDEIYKWQTASGVKRLSEAPIQLSDGPIGENVFIPIRDAIWFNIEQDAFQRYLARMSQRSK